MPNLQDQESRGVSACEPSVLLPAAYQIVSTSPSQRREILYSGRVPGVGFRYTVNRLARDYEVTGFVRNLPDGRVHLVAEGQAVEIERFVENVAQTMSGYVEDATTEVAPAGGHFGGLTTRF